MKKLIPIVLIGISFLFNTAVFSMEKLSESTVAGYDIAFKKIYSEIKENADKDAANPLIYHLTQQPEIMWDLLIKQAFQTNGFSSDDLLWIIEQFSMSQPKIGKENAQKLFEKIILTPLKMGSMDNKKNKSKSILVLLTKTYKPKYYACGNFLNKWVYGKETSDINVISIASDLGFVDALTQIFNNTEELEMFYSGAACFQRTWPKLWSSESTLMSLSFIDWLMRYEHPNPKAAIAIASIIATEALKDGKKIKGRILNLLFWLEQKNSFPIDMTWEQILKNHVADFYGLRADILLPTQKKQIKEILSSKNLIFPGQILFTKNLDQ